MPKYRKQTVNGRGRLTRWGDPEEVAMFDSGTYITYRDYLDIEAQRLHKKGWHTAIEEDHGDVALFIGLGVTG